MVKRGNKSFIVSIIVTLLWSFPFTVATEMNLTYDGNGNLITGDGNYREYNGFNQLIRVREGNNSNGTILEEYIYHPAEDRILIKKTDTGPGGSFDPDEVIVYINDNFVRIYKDGDIVVNDSYYVFDGMGLVGESVYSGNNSVYPKVFVHKGIKFYHTDHLGSASIITNSSGGFIEETLYAPYGEILAGGNVSRFDYEGREYSDITGDYDFRFRKYDPELGIFTQPDAVISQVYDPQVLNKYSFERNNPYNYIDVDGKTGIDPTNIGNYKQHVNGIKYDPTEYVTDLSDKATEIWNSKETEVRIFRIAYYATPALGDGVTLLRWSAAEQTNGLLKNDPRLNLQDSAYQSKLSQSRSDAFWAVPSLALDLTPEKYAGPVLNRVGQGSTAYSVFTNGGNIFQDIYGGGKNLVSRASSSSKNNQQTTVSTSKQTNKSTSSLLSKIKNTVRRLFSRKK